jgi:hypothetical protein
MKGSPVRVRASASLSDPVGGLDLLARIAGIHVNENIRLIHFSVFGDGTVHMTGTVRSDVSIDFLPTDGIADGTGSTVVWFGANGKLDPDTGEPFGKAVSTFTFSGRVTFTDGTRISFHQVAHVLFDATGVEKISFDKLTAHCG